jgi:hypothetical protein
MSQENWLRLDERVAIERRLGSELTEARKAFERAKVMLEATEVADIPGHPDGTHALHAATVAYNEASTN